MPEYKAPLRDMRFLIDNVFDFPGHYAALGATDASPDMVSAILQVLRKRTRAAQSQRR